MPFINCHKGGFSIYKEGYNGDYLKRLFLE